VVVTPDIVETEDVIGVRVREENRVDPADVVRERLRAEIGGGVDEDRGPAVGLDQNRRTQAPIAGIDRSADGAVAADGGNARRRPAAKDSYAKG